MQRIQMVLFAISEKNLDLTAASLNKLSVKPESLRVIYVDAVGTDESKKCCSEIGKTFSCDYIDAGGKIADGLQKAVSVMDRAPFMLCLSGTEFSERSVCAAAEKLAEGYGIVSVRPRTVSYLSSRIAEAVVTRETDCMNVRPEEGYVRFDEQIAAMHLSMDSYMFSEKYVEYAKSFRPSDDECLTLLLVDLLTRSDGYYYLSEEKTVQHNALQINNPNYSAMREKWWYTEHLDGVLTPFIEKLRNEGRLPCAAQYALASMILSRFQANFEERNLGVLESKEAIEEFYVSAGKALRNIGNKAMFRWCEDNRWSGRGQDKKVRFHRALAVRILERKAEQCGGKLEVTSDGQCICVTTPGEASVPACRADDEELDITVVNYEDGRLVIDGVFSAGDILGDRYELWAECGERRIPVDKSAVYPLIKCFGETAARRHPVRLSFEAETGISMAFFYCTEDGIKHPLRLTFNSAFSRLVTGRDAAYWVFTKGKYLSCTGGRVLRVQKINTFTRIGKELKLLLSMLSYECPGKVMMLGSIAMRCLYWLTKPFYGKKKRWITFDKLYKGGDNGEYFFRYSAERKDKVRVYYIVNSNTKEYRTLKKKYRYVLKAISPRTILTVLNSEAIAATHSTVVSYLGLPLSSRPFLRDLFNFKVCCIQHGLTVQQLAQYQNRTFDNTTLYCIASPYEHSNLMKPMYDFEEKHLKMTGLARFDGLKNDDRRFILITPTWRRNIVVSGIANIKKTHADGFKGTEYYRLYNSLINDRKLIECAKRCGYGITYLLHPAMSAQIDDYDRNDFVELVAATGDMNYERILTQASLMVTDYSGVQFDFAYMRKPIVYYHPDTLPPQYESGSIDYAETGFGPICTEHDRLIDCLCGYMENNCRNTEKYIGRADSFFAFSDYENCRRIYDEMLQFTENKE